MTYGRPAYQHAVPACLSKAAACIPQGSSLFCTILLPALIGLGAELLKTQTASVLQRRTIGSITLPPCLCTCNSAPCVRALHDACTEVQVVCGQQLHEQCPSRCPAGLLSTGRAGAIEPPYAALAACILAHISSVAACQDRTSPHAVHSPEAL